MSITLLCFILLVGAALFAAGMRGRRIDDHPLCRKCGFDLTGKPAESARCAECGADLSKPNAIRVGHRVRRRALGVAGLLLGGVAGVQLGLQGVHWGREIQWIRYSSVSLLLNNADSATPATRAPALRELGRRLAQDNLSAKKAAQIVDHALDVQADLFHIACLGMYEILVPSIVSMG